MSEEVFFLPCWRETKKVREELRNKKNEIWKTLLHAVAFKGKFLSVAKKLFVKLGKTILER